MEMLFISRDDEGRLWFDLEKAEGHGMLDLVKSIKFDERIDGEGSVTRKVELQL